MDTTNIKNSDNLIDLALVLGQQFDYSEMIRLVSQKTSQLLNAELVLVMMINPRTHQTVKTIRKEGTEITHPKYKFLQTLVSGWIMQKEKSLVIPDIKKDPNFSKANLADIPVKSVMGVPLRIEGIVIGSIILFDKKENSVFDWDDLQYLEKLSVIAAPFLRNIHNIQQYFESPLPESALLTKYEKLGLMGKSKNFIELLKSVEAAARCDVRVLLEGESGTGKELIAKAIHKLSDRHLGPFIAIDCGAIPDNLIESELFGHVKGAFTGATSEHKGLIEEANHGVLFMDEITNLPIEMQAKLLRVLQESQIRAIGSSKFRQVDVRIISASSAPLRKLVENQRFREDLFYRMYVYPISIPSLIQRREDIPMLANLFLQRFSNQQHKKAELFHETIMDFLISRSWKGNIRELENFVERLVTLVPPEKKIIDTSILPEQFSKEIKETQFIEDSFQFKQSLQESIIEHEEKLIRQALEANNWNQTKAARTLKISESAIRYKMEKLGIINPVK
jgi:transcriptional regulator with GAF, ATPase, and Fis domain